MNVLDQLHLPSLEGDLLLVEAALSAAVTVPDPFLREVAGHLVSAGGKRLRPAFVVAAAVAGGGEVDASVIDGGVAVELVHLGSLYHDDVIDEAAQRRGVASVNARWGNLVAILAGDFLLARASEIAASLGTEVAALLANTIGRLCQGEVAQLEYAFDTSRTEEAYLRAIAGKTASLLATSCRIGALTSRLERPWVDALTDFGHAFGMAFQIWDDIRDLVSTEDVLGKPAGHDLVEGTYTLPVIRALATPGVGPELAALLGGELDDPTRDKARDLIVGSDAVMAATVEGRRWADRAVASLEPLRAAAAPTEMVGGLSELGHRLLDELDPA